MIALGETLDDDRTVAWAAGIIDGEGHFGAQRWPSGVITPEVNVGMTDADVIEQLSKITDTPITVRPPRAAHHKTQYVLKVCGTRALRLMVAVLPYLSARRAERVCQILADYHETRMTVCRACGEEFYWRSTGGHRPVTCSAPCKAVDRRARDALYRAAHRDEIRQNHRAWSARKRREALA